MKLPKSWNEITIEQFIELSNLDASIGSYSYNSEALSVLSDTSIEEIEDIDIEDMANIMMWYSQDFDQLRSNFRYRLGTAIVFGNYFVCNF
jgi:hypothetical protein